MVPIPLTISGDTALHVAVSAKSTDFVRELVNYEHMTKQGLELLNTHGHTAFCLAAITGNQLDDDVFQIMIQKNENLPLIHGKDGMLAVHLAALTGHRGIVDVLCSENLLEKMDFKDIQQLFFMTIHNGMYYVAMKLVEKYPRALSIARDNAENLTALHMLARESPKTFGSELVLKLWAQVRQLECNQMLELITKPSVVLFDAVVSGNVSFLKWLLYMNPELLTIKDPTTERNLLHFVVLYRQLTIFNLLHKMGNRNLVMQAVDKDGNNVLHFAAKQLKASSGLSPSTQMQKELVWFKQVENKVPSVLKKMRNKKGKTPYDAFIDNHKELSKEVKDAAKGIANSGMVVAALIATVAFAAALTTPGDRNNAWFKVFILTNAIALFTSASSIIAFLSIFTSSRFREIDLMTITLHPILILGLILLFISVAAMVIAFAAASFLIFYHKYKWVAYVVALLGLLPIIMFLVLQSSLFDDLIDYISSKRIQLSTMLQSIVDQGELPPSNDNLV